MSDLPTDPTDVDPPDACDLDNPETQSGEPVDDPWDLPEGNE